LRGHGINYWRGPLLVKVATIHRDAISNWDAIFNWDADGNFAFIVHCKRLAKYTLLDIAKPHSGKTTS